VPLKTLLVGCVGLIYRGMNGALIHMQTQLRLKNQPKHPSQALRVIEGRGASDRIQRSPANVRHFVFLVHSCGPRCYRCTHSSDPSITSDSSATRAHCIYISSSLNSISCALVGGCVACTGRCDPSIGSFVGAILSHFILGLSKSK
jgi:hypothetical protein